MKRTERFYKIDQMLHEWRIVPIEVFLDEMDVFRATFKRGIEYMRDRLHTWCHLRNDLRSFSIDAIQRVKLLRERAKNVALAKPDSHFTSA